MPFPQRIETDRMVLRCYEKWELDAHMEILGDWEVVKWLSTNVPFPYTRFDGQKFIAEAIEQFMDGSSPRYSMINKRTGRHMGGIRVFSETAETEIGYWMHPDYWGQGFGTEVLSAVIDAGFKGGIILAFVAQTATKNMGSRRILEKTGFKHHGETPSNYARCGHQQGCDEFYRLKIEDWKLV